MKTKLSALVLCLVSIAMISCSSNKKDPIHEATEQYVKANSQQYAMVSAFSSLLGNNVSLDIPEWDPTPIDTLTRDDFYLYELKKRVKEANDFKRNTLYEDSMRIVRLKSPSSYYVTDYSKRYLEDAKETQRLHKAQYQNMVDNINLIKEKQHGIDGNEPVYFVYQFRERLIYNHPMSGEKITQEINCYSYVSLIKQAVTYVDEGANDYAPKFENLISPFKAKEFEAEDELELI